MIREGRLVGFACWLSALSALAAAGDGAHERSITSAAPLEIPHMAKLEADAKSRRKAPVNHESHQFLVLTPGLAPLPFPRNGDLRARLLTPQLRRTPVVGWVAANLYRDRKDNGWCLELDPGEGEYVVYYRLHLK